MAEESVTVNLKTKKIQAVKAVKLEHDWEDEGMNVDSKLDKSKTKSVFKPMAKEKVDAEGSSKSYCCKSARTDFPRAQKLGR